MTDKRSLPNEEIIQRLESLKQVGAEYPGDLLKKRRTSFRNAAMGLVVAVPVIGIGKGLLHLLPHTTEAALKVILVSVLMVEAGLGAYVFRDQILNWLAVETVTPTYTLPSRTPQPNLTSSGTPTFSPTATVTATIFFVDPTKKPHPTDLGYHYGQTRTPSR